MSSKRITEYVLLTEIYSVALTVSVSTHIKQGWQPYGAPFYKLDDDLYCQAVVRYAN